jgi:hypothetical protein
MIYLTGDTHGDLSRLSSPNFPLGKSLSERDYVIILGDFGAIWNPTKDVASSYWVKWLSEKPWTTLFLDGNHENFDLIDNLQTISKFGSLCGRAAEGVYHLRRGNIYTIDNKSFFVMGGAASIDKDMRTENLSWWARENPSEEEINKAWASLASVGMEVDYVLTHTCPSQVKKNLLMTYGFADNFHDPLENHLAEMEYKIKFKHWFFGHFHQNVTLGKFTCLYEEIHDLEDFVCNLTKRGQP